MAGRGALYRTLERRARMDQRVAFYAAVLWLALVPSTGSVHGAEEPTNGHSGEMAFHSPFFAHGGRMPAYFTCDGPNTPPELRWTLPANALSVALVLEDVSAWALAEERVHWVAWDIPGEVIAGGQELDAGVEGVSDFVRTAGYRGPCPVDRNAEHIYRFTLVAVDKRSLTATQTWEGGILLTRLSTWPDVERAVKAHEVARATLSFAYKRGAPAVTLPPRIVDPSVGVKGNPVLSKKYSPELLCFTCMEVARVVEARLKPSTFAKSDARAAREQAAAVAEALDEVCAQDNFLRSPFPPLQVAQSCEYLIHEYDDTDADRAFLDFRGPERLKQLCHVSTGACRGFSAADVAGWSMHAHIPDCC